MTSGEFALVVCELIEALLPTGQAGDSYQIPPLYHI